MGLGAREKQGYPTVVEARFAVPVPTCSFSRFGNGERGGRGESSSSWPG